jgi:hypothetical protein
MRLVAQDESVLQRQPVINGVIVPNACIGHGMPCPYCGEGKLRE